MLVHMRVFQFCARIELPDNLFVHGGKRIIKKGEAE